MKISDALDSLTPRGQGEFQILLPDPWRQGRTIFGGMQAAALLHAIRASLPPGVPADIPLRSLQSVFVGPILPGPTRLTVEILRQGKSTLQTQARLWSGDEVGCTAIAVLGQPRRSGAEVPLPEIQPACSFEQARRKPFVEGQSPEFARNVEQRWAHGDWPYTGGRDAHNQIYVYYPGETQVSESLVIAMADTIPSPAYSMLKDFAPASSLCWTLEFLRHDHHSLDSRGWLMDTRVISACDGYIFQDATLFGPDHRAFALSRQSVVVFG